MRYKKFIIKNYRAITGPLEINVDKNSLTPIIGINESGKTTILHAICAFDYFNDELNENGRHLRDTVNLYRTSSPNATIEATIEFTKHELLDAISECESENVTLGPHLSHLKRKHKIPDELSITRDLKTQEYTINNYQLSGPSTDDALARSILRSLPYILFFDDFRDKIDDKIEITGSETDSHDGWLSIIQQLFRQTDKKLSVFDLPTIEERQRKTILAKVTRHLNETLTKAWQAFRLDDREALKISIDYIQEARSYIKLDIVETDANGDTHYFFISDRSKGFYWFFNFVMKLEFNPKTVTGDGTNTIYLLDEPGSYLHASAQRKLCGKLRQLSDKNRVIYCTHSHYLLDPETIPISTIAVADKDGHGTIHLIPLLDYHGTALEKRSALQPVIDALQIKPFILDLTDARVIVTEGMTDYFALELFKNARPISVLPSVGAESIKFYVSLMIAWQVDFHALWDHDEEGIKRYEQASELFGSEVKKKNLRLLPPAGHRKRILQDLFAGEDIVLIREELGLPKNCPFSRTLQALFYSPRRTEIVQMIGSKTKANFDDLFTSLGLSQERTV